MKVNQKINLGVALELAERVEEICALFGFSDEVVRMRKMFKKFGKALRSDFKIPKQKKLDLDLEIWLLSNSLTVFEEMERWALENLPIARHRVNGRIRYTSLI